MFKPENLTGTSDIFVTRRIVLAGLFGFVILGLLLIPFYYIPGQKPFFPGERVEDVPLALQQMKDNYIIIIATIGRNKDHTFD